MLPEKDCWYHDSASFNSVFNAPCQIYEGSLLTLHFRLFPFFLKPPTYFTSLFIVDVILRLAEWAPKDVHTLIPGTSEYIIFHGKMDFADMIKIMGFTIERVS